MQLHLAVVRTMVHSATMHGVAQMSFHRVGSQMFGISPCRLGDHQGEACLEGGRP